jgi:hypothetical protein
MACVEARHEMRERATVSRCAWCGEEVGEFYVTVGFDVYHQEVDRDCYGLLLKHSKKCAGE